MRRHTPALLVGIVAVALAVVVLVFAVRLASNARTGGALARNAFEVGTVSELDKAISAGPLLFHDPLGHGRDLVITRAGDRFVAFTTTEKGCLLSIDREHRQVVDCHGSAVTFDPSRTPAYPVHIENGKVTVDLRVTPTTVAGVSSSAP